VTTECNIRLIADAIITSHTGITYHVELTLNARSRTTV